MKADRASASELGRGVLSSRRDAAAILHPSVASRIDSPKNGR